ncbi:hypothetical protein IQ07DRAFT_81967 [Pyrenochaeta sp. DS3sAY3a]|nr:hypothetical protein IQ07DRAFT_81967 [Pyrenochaeta sp. DS3sAY3a]
MKFTAIFAIFAFALAVFADTTFYNPERNVTCTHITDTGAIDCQPGQEPGVEVVSLETAVSPAIRGRSANPLDKRVTCGVDSRLCFLHCFAIGYCNSGCDDKGICRCYCYDISPWPLVCTKKRGC